MDDIAGVTDEMNQLSSESQSPEFDNRSDSSPKTGIVYILSNEAMPGYIKIGITNGHSPIDVKRRMNGLDSSNLPLPFECEYAAVVPNYERVEKALHTAFGDYRVNRRREFFKDIEVFRVKSVVDLLMIKDVTPELIDTEVEDSFPIGIRREKFTFKMVNVPEGATLQLVGATDKTCTVAGTKTEVEYDGDLYSMSGLAKELKQSKWSLQGPRYWIYEDETLQTRRERLEKEAGVDDE